jgi:hypothetical protein
MRLHRLPVKTDDLCRNIPGIHAYQHDDRKRLLKPVPGFLTMPDARLKRWSIF